MPLSCNLGTLTSWNPLGHFRPVTGLLNPLYSRLCEPHGRAGRERKILPSPGFDPRTVQAVASLCRLSYSGPHFLSDTVYCKQRSSWKFISKVSRSRGHLRLSERCYRRFRPCGLRICVFCSADRLLTLVAGDVLCGTSGSNNFLGMTATRDEENTILPDVWNYSLHSQRRLNVF